jgi:hypothetical protein
MSGFLTGPELSREAVRRLWLALGDVAVVHAPSSPNNETAVRLIAVFLSILSFMGEVTLREHGCAMTQAGDF